MRTTTLTIRTGAEEVVHDLTRDCADFVRGHGRSHVMPALIPPYASVPVPDGRLMLGTWQSVCLVDLNVDNVERSVRLDLLSG